MLTELKVEEIRDREVIENFLREDPYMHLYCLGDLDDFYWPMTKWICIREKTRIHAIILLYEDIYMPVLLAFNRNGDLPEITGVASLLPDRLNAHLTPDFREFLSREFRVISPVVHHKMALMDAAKIKKENVKGVERLGPEDKEDLLDLYRSGYSNNWFNERMLETGFYFGIRSEDRLISVAGVHVYSKKYRVAALGNITTHPAFRNQGLARKVTARLCQVLFPHVDHIGLNVHAGNIPAIRSYGHLGFTVIGDYEECRLIKRDLKGEEGTT